MNVTLKNMAVFICMWTLRRLLVKEIRLTALDVMVVMFCCFDVTALLMLASK